MKEEYVKYVSDLIRYEWVISADTILGSITTKTRMRRIEVRKRGEYRVKFKEEGPEFTALSIVEYSGSAASRERGFTFAAHEGWQPQNKGE